MFTTQISSLKSQLAEINERINRYTEVEREFAFVVEAIAQLQQKASELSPESGYYVRDELANRLGVTPTAPLPSDEVDLLRQQLQVETNYFQQERVEYSTMVRDLQTRVSGYELSSDLYEFVTTGESSADWIMDFDHQLMEIGLSLQKTPDWCLEARMRHIWGEACELVRQKLGDYLPEELVAMWQQFEVENQSASETSKTAESLMGETPKTAFRIDVRAQEIPNNRYDSAEQISAALADAEEVDTHLMAIASILDTCPENEIAGRTWFFVQNIPAEFDQRLLGYLPQSIRLEWDRQRTAYEDEMRASILSETIDYTLRTSAESAPQADSGWVNLVVETGCLNASRSTYNQSQEDDEEEEGLFKRETQEWGEDLDEHEHGQTNIFDAIEEVEEPQQSFQENDLVQLPDGRVCRVEGLVNSGGAKLATVIMPDGGKGSFHCSTLKYFGKYEEPKVNANEFTKGDWVELYDGTVCEVLRVAEVGDVTYFEVMHQGARTAFRATDLKPATKPETASTTKTKTKKVKASKTTSADILKCSTWGEIRAIANGNAQLLKDAALSANTKSEKELIENLPEMIRQWQMDNRDFSDFDWMPRYLVQSVRSLLSAPGTAA